MKHYLAAFVSALLITPLFAAPPTPPNGISARTTSAGYVEINWSRASDSDGYIIGYELIRNGTAIKVGDVTQYIDSNIQSGVRYTYQVAAIDNDNEKAVGNNTVSISTSGGASGGTASSGSSSTNSRLSAAVPATYCIDEDGDGWGWDGLASCLVNATAIIDCAVDQSCVIADTLETNSNGTERSTSTTVTVCIDTDGDGWGWTGTESCKIELDIRPQATICIDTDGDGWGWTGTDTCIP